jgi:hypothetical protein
MVQDKRSPDWRALSADWGLSWNMAIESGGWVVGDEIRIDLDLEAVEAPQVAVPG